MTTDEITDLILDLPVKQRMIMANVLLNTLDQQNPDLAKAWTEEVDRQIAELQKIRILEDENAE